MNIRTFFSALLVMAFMATTNNSYASTFTHPSVCEGTQKWTANLLKFSKFGVENNTNQNLWLNCPLAISYSGANEFYSFATFFGNTTGRWLEATCILNTLGNSGLTSRSKTIVIPPYGSEYADWTVYDSLTGANFTCKLPPGAHLASLGSV